MGERVPRTERWVIVAPSGIGSEVMLRSAGRGMVGAGTLDGAHEVSTEGLEVGVLSWYVVRTKTFGAMACFPNLVGGGKGATDRR